MADYVTTLIVITGPTASLQSLVQAHLSSNTFDFNTITRMPDGLDIESGSAIETGYAALYGDWQSVAAYWMFKEPAEKFGYPFPLASREQVLTSLRSFDCPDIYLGPAAQYHHNMQTHGHGDWYSWCNEYWGTKHNADEVAVQIEPDVVRLKFVTAGKYPKPVLDTLSKSFSDLEFHVRHFDENLRGVKDFVLVNGRETKKTKRVPSEVLAEVQAAFAATKRTD